MAERRQKTERLPNLETEQNRRHRVDKHCGPAGPERRGKRPVGRRIRQRSRAKGQRNPYPSGHQRCDSPMKPHEQPHAGAAFGSLNLSLDYRYERIVSGLDYRPDLECSWSQATFEGTRASLPWPPKSWLIDQVAEASRELVRSQRRGQPRPLVRKEAQAATLVTAPKRAAGGSHCGTERVPFRACPGTSPSTNTPTAQRRWRCGVRRSRARSIPDKPGAPAPRGSRAPRVPRTGAARGCAPVGERNPPAAS